MEIKIIYVTPEIAGRWLKNNPVNRKLKRHLIDRYVKDMKLGKWKENTGETIKISISGALLDGQHRLISIVQSGVSLYFPVAFNINDSVMDVLDTGQARNITDVFNMSHIKNASVVSGIISSYINLKTNAESRGKIKITNATMLNEYNANENYWQEVSTNSQQWYHACGRILSTSVLGCFYAVFSEIDKDDAFNFFELLTTGNGTPSKAVNFLRTRLSNAKFTTSKLSDNQRNALIIKAWNFYRKGVEIKNLKFDSEKEAFPIPA